MKVARTLMPLLTILASLFSPTTTSLGAEREVPASMAPLGDHPPLDEWSHPAGFKFWLPDNWKVVGDGDTLTVEGQGGKVLLVFFVPKNVRSMERALDEIDEELAAWMKNIKFDKPSTSSEGGISEVFISGTGQDREDGTELEFDLGIYEKKGKYLIVFGATPAENFDHYDATFRKILDSIR